MRTKQYTNLVAKHQDEVVAASFLAADTWTAYRFAALPLSRSLVDAVSFAWEGVKKHPPRRTARGFNVNISESNDSVVLDGRTFDRTCTVNERLKASILWTGENQKHDWRYELGLRNKDIPETLWQLLPLSFMVDRVSNISNSIRAVTNLLDPSLSILAGSVVRRSEVTQTIRLSKHSASGWDISIANPSTITQKSFVYERSTWNPSLSDIRPGFQPAGLVEDFTKTADLLAIIVGRLQTPYNKETLKNVHRNTVR